MGEKHSSSRRRRLLRGLIVTLVVLVFVALPAYLATRPQYFARFDELSAQYDPWSTSTHVAAACQDCHVPPRVVARTAYAVRMVGEFYVSLVVPSHTPAVFEKPTNAACLNCHEDLRSISPEGDLKIPHRAHVNILKMECVSCHKYLVHEESPEGNHTPPMSGCLTCHDGDTAKNTCSACHTEKATPKSHAAKDWLVIHADEAKSGKCDGCHAWIDDWCVDCHTKRPRSHAGDWRATHRDQVAKHRSCEACHAAAFCEKCHGTVPQLNYDPALKPVE
jgi:hypothetical protein